MFLADALSPHSGAGPLAALLALCLWAGGASMVRAQPGPVGQFEGHGDVGAPALSGSATWNAASQEYRLSAAGVNMWGPRDEFQFVWKRLKGDFILRSGWSSRGRAWTRTARRGSLPERVSSRTRPTPTPWRTGTG